MTTMQIESALRRLRLRLEEADPSERGGIAPHTDVEKVRLLLQGGDLVNDLREADYRFRDPQLTPLARRLWGHRPQVRQHLEWVVAQCDALEAWPPATEGGPLEYFRSKFAPPGQHPLRPSPPTVDPRQRLIDFDL